MGLARAMPSGGVVDPVGQANSIVPVATEENLQVIVAQSSGACAVVPEGTIRAYCGARVSDTMRFEESRLRDGVAPGMPVPAWTDVGMASHMRGMCGLQRHSTSVWRSRGSALPQVLRPDLSARDCAFRFLLAASSALENVFCWAAYFEVKDPSSNLYNKFEAYALGVPGLHAGMAAMASLNSAYLFVFWVLVVVWRIDTHRALAFGRLPLSAGSGLVCLIVVFFSESTQVFSFLCTLCVLAHCQALLLGGLLTRRGKDPTASQRIRIFVMSIAIASIAAAWCFMYGFDGMGFLREDTCRATENSAMPVRIRGLNRWQCVRWGSPHRIERWPAAAEEEIQAECATPFHTLDAAVDVGSGAPLLWRPSGGAHFVRCPPSCQSFGLGLEVVGCRVYDARSSICAAAVQVGVIDSDVGGLVKVVGREPPTSYERCNLNRVVSVKTVDALPGTALIASRPSEPITLDIDELLDEAKSANGSATVADILGQQNRTITGAFYFQEVEGSEADDVVTLHSFRKISTPEAKQPYRSYVADVSWRIGGGDLQRRQVVLGPDPDADIELNFCHDGSAEPQNRCE